MFTVEQIKTAHAKVRSGTDFPKYIQDIKTLGVMAYETWVEDGHTEYFGVDDYQTSSKPMYEGLAIVNSSDKTTFTHYLKIHQQGQTDYLTFCRQCAETGVEKWFVCLEKMTCTYYDRAGNEILVEEIPALS